MCAWAVHRPDRRGDARNHHAHIVLPTRRLSEDGEKLGAKLRQLDLSTKSKAEVQAIRSHWQRVANVALEAAGERARVDTGRAAAGVMPQPTLGPACTAIERRVRPEAPYGTSVAALVRLETPAPGADGAPLTWRGEALRAWGEPEARRARSRLQTQDPDLVTEDLVVTVASTAVAARFGQERPAEPPLAALAHPRSGGGGEHAVVSRGGQASGAGPACASAPRRRPRAREEPGALARGATGTSWPRPAAQIR